MVEKMVENLRTNPQSPGRNPPITRSTSWTWKTFSNTGPKDKRVWFNSCSCLCTKNIHFKSPLSPPWNTKIAITLISGVLLSPSEVLTVTSFLWRSTIKKKNSLCFQKQQNSYFRGILWVLYGGWVPSAPCITSEILAARSFLYD